MSDPIWYRSLYFRIAFGFVALLATLLVLQGAVFLWMSGRMPELLFSRSAAQLADAIAGDVAEMLADPSVTDLSGGSEPRVFRRQAAGSWSRSRTGGSSRAVACLLRRSSAARRATGSMSVRPDLRGPGRDEWSRGRRPARASRRRFRRARWAGFGPARDRADCAARRRRWAGKDSARGGGRGGRVPVSAAEFSDVAFAGRTYGVVAVPLEPPPASFMLQRLGPTLGFVAFALLVVGTAVGAFVIVGPTRRRLQQLQDAARALGAGEPVRARRRPAATRSRRCRTRSTKWPRSSSRGRAPSSRRIARGASCWRMSRTS